MKRATELCKFMPVEFKLIKRLLCSFGTLHIDMDPLLPQPVIFSIASSRFIELMGEMYSRLLTDHELNGLYVLAGNQSTEGSLLDLLYTDFLKAKHIGRRNNYYRTFKTFVDYMIEANNFNKLQNILQQVTEGDSAQDIHILIQKPLNSIRVYKSALIKSCLYNCYTSDNNNNLFPSFSNMKSSLGRNFNKQSFISAKIEVPEGHAHRIDGEAQMFGRLKYMFRFTFTTGINDIPIGAVDWADFHCENHFRVCSVGTITELEWSEGPQQNNKYHEFIPLGEVFPSRYCFAYDPVQFQRLNCAFISLDPERLGNDLNDEFDQDFGDNQFPHYRGNKSNDISYLSNIHQTQNDSSSDEEEDNNSGEEDISLRRNNIMPHVPNSIHQFLQTAMIE